METGQKLLLGGVTAIALCIGLYLLIYESRVVTDMFNVVRDQIKEEELYQQYYAEDIEEISYAELVAILLNNLEYDINVNGVLIKKEEHDIDKINVYGLNLTDYLKQYQYDESGNITLISYTSKR